MPIVEWHHSAEAGCITCCLIWDILLYVDEELVTELTDSEELAYVYLNGIIGQSPTLQLGDMLPRKYFPLLVLYSMDSMDMNFSSRDF